MRDEEDASGTSISASQGVQVGTGNFQRNDIKHSRDDSQQIQPGRDATVAGRDLYINNYYLNEISPDKGTASSSVANAAIGEIDRSAVRVFLSYEAGSGKESFAHALRDKLSALGYEVCLVRDAELEWLIERAIASRAHYLLWSLSGYSLASYSTGAQWRGDLDRLLAERRVRVIPILSEPCTPPPVLQGRVIIAGSSSYQLLINSHLEIDWAIQENERREQVAPREASYDAPVHSLVNGRIELEHALSLGLEDIRGLEHAYAASQAIRQSAMKCYDIGYRDLAAAMYREVIHSLDHASIDSRRFPFLREHGESLNRSMRYIAENPSADAWKLRMVLDEVIDYLHGILLIEKVRNRTIQAAAGRRWNKYRDHWQPFEPLRCVIEPWGGYEFSSFGLLCSVCNAAMDAVERHLAKGAEMVQQEINLEDAVVLRILRWSIRSQNHKTDSASYEAESGEKASNPVHALWDIYNLNMSNFSHARFFWNLISDVDRETFLRGPTSRIFDMVLTARGYPRDSDFWTEAAEL